MRYLMLAVFAVGCGTANTPVEVDPFTDTAWATPISGVDCTKGFGFQSGAYTFVVICTLTDGSAGAYVENGIYDVMPADRHIFMTATAASCPSAAVEISLEATYSITETALTLADATGFTTYQRLNLTVPGSGSNGCFSADGSFAPYPLMPL